MAKVAYIRVSTVEQNEERQIEGLKKYGTFDKQFIEKVSAKDMNRPKLQSMLEYVREGDTIYVLDFSRLARSTKDLLDIVEMLKEKKVELVSDKENIDTNTATGELLLTMIAAINNFERANLLERQREGIAIAKNKGIYKGRKKIQFPKNWEDVYGQYKSRGIKGKEAMEKLKLKRNTFYKLLREHESQQKQKDETVQNDIENLR